MKTTKAWAVVNKETGKLIIAYPLKEMANNWKGEKDKEIIRIEIIKKIK